MTWEVIARIQDTMHSDIFERNHHVQTTRISRIDGLRGIHGDRHLARRTRGYLWIDHEQLGLDANLHRPDHRTVVGHGVDVA